MQNRRAVVVGAGVAGLASAIVLSRLGWRVALLERRERLKGENLGMVLWASGVRALRALGVDALLDASGTPVDRFEIRSEERLSSSFAAAMLGADDGTPSVMVHTAMLYEALVSRLGDSVEVHPATQVDRIDLVDLAAGDASRRWDADLVVAADGIDSPTRQLVAPGSPTVDAGVVSFRGLVPAHRAPERTTDAVEIYGPDRRRFGYGDLGHAGACWWATVPGGMRPESPQIQYELINRWFADWPAPVGKFIAATRPSELTQQAVRYVWPVPPVLHQRVGNGGLVLLGDAAHGVAPILAQGGSLALEDAVTLGWALRRSPESVPAALGSYDRARMARIKRVARLSRRVHTIASGGRGMTKSLLRAVPDSWVQNQAASLSDWQPPR
ncbi:FAD-dependent oxidoreductase [Glycomyces niveus]|jgi:2-polyprenyl-6-methoxyphenol hydroxylase-like FAD-dependent oxidoreductase|uniref:FAD-dependent monooxygenase n=1 Tax=Glycomyces niveus TaxID=2820287 RepID=A0ABS3TXZ4_9ACTN|nr:NAD(P)/FAD-dependent oxidoreductase [Glycomyces sp. NEAU-S30]MBO3731378.1 FAD-dependent monooxygenase [Glycomyces sp. NEAU-S30]